MSDVQQNMQLSNTGSRTGAGEPYTQSNVLPEGNQTSVGEIP